MRTMFVDATGNKMKTRDGDIDIQKDEFVLWEGKEIAVTKVVYDVLNDIKSIFLNT